MSVLSQQLEKEKYKTPVLPEDFIITKDGIENYNWPIPHQDILNFGQDLEQKLAKFYREYPDQDQILPYKIAAKNYMTSICACFQAELLKHRSEEQELDMDIPNNLTFWASIFNEDRPPVAPYLQGLRNSQNKQMLWQRLLKPENWIKAFKKVRFSKSGTFQVDGLLLGAISKEKLSQVVVATQRLPLISRHAKTLEQDVYLKPSSAWFNPITDEDLKNVKSDQENLITSQVMAFIKESYQQHGVSISIHTEEYLQDTLKDFISLIQIHIQRLQKRDDLPKTLWTGSGGHIWDVMLRCEVKRRDNRVVAHDHGGGVPHLNHPEKGWVEMWACDEFVTYSAEQVKTFEIFKHEWPNLDKDLPKVSALDGMTGEPEFVTFEKFTKESSKIKNIRVFSTIYSSEEGRGLPIYPHVPYIDWQARLTSCLKSIGYNVSLKLHPDSRLMLPSSFSNSLVIDVIETSLEGMGDNFDLYIFDLSNTSVLQTALMTNKPILIIDFGVMEWRKDAFEMFQKRCGYVNGFYEGSRMYVDWDNLAKQVELASSKCNNHEFASTYYF